MGGGVVAVQAVKEDDAGLAVFPSLVDDPLIDLAGVHGAAFFLVAGVVQVVFFITLHGLHEFFGQADGDVEVVELLLVGLAHDEIHDIRVVNPQDAHIGAAPCAALLDGFGGGIEDPHEGDRAAGDAGGGQHQVIGRTQTGEGEAGAAARLVDHGGELDRIEDLFDGVAHRQHETGRELAQFTTGVHQGRGVGHKVEAGHHPVETVGQFFEIGFFVELPIRFGNRIGNAAQHVGRRLKRLAVGVPLQVPFFKDGSGVLGKRRLDGGG